MSVKLRIEEWLRKMEYDGEVPLSLSKICNPTAAFIWEQLITNVKPRQEVEFQRHNIIVNRLSKKPLLQQDQFRYPIKEIQIYMEKQRLEKEEAYLEKRIKEKEDTVDEQVKKNKLRYVTINNTKARTKENQEKTYLLKKKSRLLESDLQNARDTLTLARNLTPVELDASANGDEITQTLQQCAEKLQKLSHSFSWPKATKNRSLSTSVKRGKTPKYSSKANTFSSKKINTSTNKENINSNQHGTHISRSLKFFDSDISDVTPKKPKRESLGLLPEECMNEYLDEFSETMLELVFDKNLDLIEKLRSDKNVPELLKNLLHKNNRYLILTQTKNVYEQLLKEMGNSLMDGNKLFRSDRGISKDDLMELYFLHVKNELEKEKCRLICKKSQNSVKRKKEDLFYQMSNTNREEVRTVFELQIEEAYLDGANNFLRKEINDLKKCENKNELQLINVKIKQAEEDIISKNSHIQTLMDAINKVLKDIKNNREETILCILKLNPFVNDLSWAEAMTEDTNSAEIELFKTFPLEFNRKFKHTRSQTFKRSIVATSIPPYIKLDSTELEMITNIIDTPFASAVNVIFDALRTKKLLNKLKSVEILAELPKPEYQTYALEELVEKEKCLEPLMNKLNCIIHSNSVKRILSLPEAIKEVTDLWLELPMVNYISEKRKVDGHDHKYYDKKLQELSAQ